MTAALSGCGGSSTSDSIPSTVSIFYEHSVLIKDGSVYTMGYNGFGQLGDGTLKKREVATPVTAVTGMVNMTKAVAGAEHTMATNGTSVWAWGFNLYGQLGNDPVLTSYPNDYKSSPVLVKFPDGTGAPTDIAAGGYHSLAIAGGKLYGWGSNSHGQVGADAAHAKEPVPVSLDTDADNNTLTTLTATGVAAGGLHSLALFDNGDVYAWGSNAYGQIGVSTDTKTVSRPKKVTFGAPGGTIEQIAALSSASLALAVERTGGTITSQTLWGWGYNDAGELGTGIELLKSSEVPVKVFPTIPVSDANTYVIKKIATGMNHILLLMGKRDTTVNDGAWYVQTIGLNAYGQLGNNTTTNSSSLQAVYTALNPEWNVGVSDIAAFGTSSFALVNGVWYAWGNNGVGQLGNKIATDSVAFFETPVTVKFQ